MEQRKLTLKELRLKAGLTQLQLAFKSGVSLSAIANAESGRHLPSLDNAIKLVAALNVTLNDVAWMAQNGDSEIES